MTAETDYMEARIKVIRARSRALATGKELQTRLAPKSIAQDAWTTVKDRGEALAERSVETIKTHPGATAGAGAGALLLLLRKPLWRGARRLFGRGKRESKAQGET